MLFGLIIPIFGIRAILTSITVAVETIMEGILTSRFLKWRFKIFFIETVMIILIGFFNLAQNWELEILEKFTKERRLDYSIQILKPLWQ